MYSLSLSVCLSVGLCLCLSVCLSLSPLCTGIHRELDSDNRTVLP